MRSLASLVLAVLILPTTTRAAELRYFEDAALHAVQFWDKSEGWAVGDEGVVWHTTDGGKNWERQPTRVRASLRSLCCLSPFHIWVAGREELPGGGSTGVLLFTEDGGINWQRALLHVMPGLNVVRFANEKVGFVAGDGSDQHPSGVFMTTNSGESWQPVAGPRAPTWLAGAYGQEGAVLVGAWNRLATLKEERLHVLDEDALGGRGLRGVHFLERRGFAVGQGGLLLVSDGGKGSAWGYANLGLENSVVETLDFHAIHGAGQKLWAVGRPGSVILHSPDQGGRWLVQKAPNFAPLNGVFFLDDRTGWAVGELGSILATVDGGKTWQIQRRGGQRCAVLVVHGRASSFPLDVVAAVGAEEGYLTAGLRLTAPDAVSAAQGRAAEGMRLAAAMRQAGGAAGEMLWQFPVASHLAACDRQELLAGWNVLHGGRATDQMLRQMILALRMWRPDVVLTDNTDNKETGSAVDGLTAEALREALRQAGNPKVCPEQITVLGLEPWQPSKLYALTDNKGTGVVALNLTEISPMLQASPREYVSGPLALLSDRGAPVERAYRLLAGVDGAAQHRHLLQGCDLAQGGVARRTLTPTKEPPDELLQALRQQATLRTLAEAPPSQLTDPNRLLGQLGPMLEKLPDDVAARTAHTVAAQLARNGQWTLAREVYLMLAERYPAHPLTAEAYKWLIRLGSSSEARRRQELGQFVVAQELSLGVVGPKQTITLTSGEEEEQPGPQKDKPRKVQLPQVGSRLDATLAIPVSGSNVRKWYEGALEMESRLAALGPVHVNDPTIQFCLQAARRRLGDIESAKKWYAQFVNRQPEGPWRNAALAELWLLDRRGPAPKPLALCAFTETKPYLDGKLDDACWQSARPVVLQNAVGKTGEDYPTEVRLAHDRQYLYVALRCFHPQGQQVEQAKPRGHDVDMRRFDRVSLMLDLDRDYSTCFHFQVDQRGCVADECWGDRSWDPKWHVAVNSEGGCWTVEAAIPLLALTGDNILPGQSWCFNAVRVLPGRGVQGWSLPAEAPEESLRPEGWGLLMFIAEPRPNPGNRSEAPAVMPRSN
jgi:photosystem II stability/assembly factor-like uncharacterized protein